jgi:hypothetical protein
MSEKKIGMIVWIATKANGLKDAWEIYEATKSKEAAINVAAKISEIVAGMAAGYTIITTHREATAYYRRIFYLFLPSFG